MSALLRIRQLYPMLALNERRLADYLLSQPDRCRYLSSPQLAQEAGVSQSSVVKFAQKLGYKGFPALKLALSESLADKENITLPHPVLNGDSLKITGEKLLSEKTSAIRATLDINSEEKVLESLALLKNARRIVLTGIGTSGLVAKDLSWKLMKLGLFAVAEQDMHALLSRVQALQPGDVLLAISCTGEHREINLAVEEAVRAGVYVLAFTSFTPNTLQQCATHCLYTVAEGQTTRSAAISSTSAQLALADLLFMALLQNDADRASHNTGHRDALVKKPV